jgi:MFS family permease
MQAEILKDLRHNYFYNILDGAFFGFALGFASFITVIPLFVSAYTDSAILIGLVPAIHNMGWQLPQLLIANRVSQQTRFKPLLLKYTIQERIPFLFMALVAWVSPHISTQLTLIAIFLLLIWQGLAGGFSASPWQSMIAKIFPTDRRGTFYGSQSSAANLLAAISAILAGFILGRIESPTDFTICFLFAGIILGISWLALAQTREPVSETTPPSRAPREFWENIAAILKSDSNFRWFLAARMLSQVAVMGFSFYTVYAVKTLGMSEITVGVLTGVLMGTAIIANPVMGWIGDRWSHRKLMAVGVLSASLSGMIAWAATSPSWFYTVFILAGIANVAVWTISIAIIPDFSPEAERPSYIGLANTLIAPVTILAPLLGGWLAQTGGYQTAFIASAIGGVLTSLILVVYVKEPHPLTRAGTILLKEKL